MYIEFKIPHSGDWKQISYVESLKNNIQIWARLHNIPYRTKQVKNFLRLTFDDDSYYTLFTMTWNSEKIWTSFRLITDLNNK